MIDIPHMPHDYSILPPGSTVSVVPPIAHTATICTDSLFMIDRNNTSYMSYITFPTPKVELIDISCPKCGSSRYRKTDIKNVVECEYCGSHFGVKYDYE